MMIAIPITSCAECHEAFSLSEWRALEPWIFSGERHGDQVDIGKGPSETRRCNCDAKLSARVEGLDELDLMMPAERYAGLYPQAGRVPELVAAPSWWRRWSQVLTMAAIAVVAVAAAALVVIGLTRALL